MNLQDFDFRVWDNSKKRFYNNLELSMFPSNKNSLNVNLGIIFARNLKSASLFGSNYEIELYTGFKDKNGIMIYEGDIVGICDIDGIYEKRSIVFENAGFVLKHTKAIYGYIPLSNLYQTQKELDNVDSKILKYIRVLGNIHKNSKLLKTKE